MVSEPEQKLSRLLRLALAELPNGAFIPNTEQFRETLTCLAWFIPSVLEENHREWRFQGVDDIVPVEAQKTGDDELRIFGVCCFVNDQTITPLYLHFQNALVDDQISWLICKLGELEEGGMVKKPYRDLRSMAKHCHVLNSRVEQVDWAYNVTFGHRRG